MALPALALLSPALSLAKPLVEALPLAKGLLPKDGKNEGQDTV